MCYPLKERESLSVNCRKQKGKDGSGRAKKFGLQYSVEGVQYLPLVPGMGPSLGIMMNSDSPELKVRHGPISGAKY